MRGVDGKIHRRPVPIRQTLREFSRELQTLFGVQLMRQRDLEFAGDPRILAIFALLGGIPQSRTIQSPFGSTPFGNDDLAMLDALPPGKIMCQSIALVRQAFAGAIGG